MGLRFCCEMCGWGKRSLFCAGKMITYHFSVLVLSLSKWICSQQCHRVSLEMFFIVSEGLSGAMLWAQNPWPGPLSPSASVPIRFPPIFLAPHTIWSMLFTLPLWSTRWRTLCALLSSFPASLTVRHTNYEKLESGSLTPKITCTKTATKGFKVFHLFTLQHREILVDFDTWTSLWNDPLCITRLNSYFK